MAVQENNFEDFVPQVPHQGHQIFSDIGRRSNRPFQRSLFAYHAPSQFHGSLDLGDLGRTQVLDLAQLRGITSTDGAQGLEFAQQFAAQVNSAGSFHPCTDENGQEFSIA